MDNLRKDKELVEFVEKNALMMGMNEESLWSALETLQNNLSEKAVTAAEAGKKLREMFHLFSKKENNGS